MEKLKLYLDTSVISFLEAEDAPEKRTISRTFWKAVKNRRYEITISRLLLVEIGRCQEPLRSNLLTHLAAIEYTLLDESTGVIGLAERYIEKRIIPARFRDDALHLAHATIAGCDAVVSWNFRHMVRLEVIKSIKSINEALGFAQLEIVTPQSFSEGE
jgi:hypothetical protein